MNVVIGVKSKTDVLLWVFSQQTIQLFLQNNTIRKLNPSKSQSTNLQL